MFFNLTLKDYIGEDKFMKNEDETKKLKPDGLDMCQLVDTQHFRLTKIVYEDLELAGLAATPFIAAHPRQFNFAGLQRTIAGCYFRQQCPQYAAHLNATYVRTC